MFLSSSLTWKSNAKIRHLTPALTFWRGYSNLLGNVRPLKNTMEAVDLFPGKVETACSFCGSQTVLKLSFKPR